MKLVSTKTEQKSIGLDAAAFLLLVVCFCTAVNAQNVDNSLSGQIDSSDHFNIAPGQSISATFPGGRRSPAVGTASIINDIDDVLRLILQNHVDGNRIAAENLVESGSNGMLQSLDPHSRFFSAPDFRELLGDHQSEYAGIGVTIYTQSRDGRSETYILTTAESSPAEKARLTFGDRIIAVNGKPAAGLDSDEIRHLLRGKIGTRVRLIIERNISGVVEMIDFRRANIPIRSVKDAYRIDESTGYIDLTVGFAYSTPVELKAAVERLSADGIKSLVIDLRSNRGGLVESAVKAAEVFLPRGAAILSERGRFPDDYRLYSSNNPDPIAIPIVLLVNGETASAAEIFAGALQDNDRAIIVGERTFGKGLVQEVVGFENGAGMSLTAARYYTPSGRSIQREYSDGHRYDYFRNAGKGSVIDSPYSASKTLTQRVVYNGNGIAPDVWFHSGPGNEDSAQNIGDAFLFAKELAAGIGFESLEKRPISHCGAFDQTDGFTALKEMSSAYTALITGKIELAPAAGLSQNEFVVQARKFFTYALCGRQASERLDLLADPIIKEAVKAIPAAAELAEKADRVRRNVK